MAPHADRPDFGQARDATRHGTGEAMRSEVRRRTDGAIAGNMPADCRPRKRGITRESGECGAARTSRRGVASGIAEGNSECSRRAPNDRDRKARHTEPRHAALARRQFDAESLRAAGAAHAPFVLSRTFLLHVRRCRSDVDRARRVRRLKCETAPRAVISS